MAFIICNILCVAALVGIDQLIKQWAVAVLAPVGSITLIPHVVELRFVLNSGMAFSLLSGQQNLLIVVTLFVLAGVAWFLFTQCRGRRLYQVTAILVLAGGIGNLIDRMLNGVVVDYVNFLFVDFAVFNFADVCLTVGIGLMILCILLDDIHSGKQTGETDRGTEA